jgi:hypothetical protein
VKIITCLVVLWLLAQSSTTHALSGSPIDGQVLEYDTGRPVPGAIVIARWVGNIVGSGQTPCVHAESAVADADGTYRIASWSRLPPALILGTSAMLNAYKSGFESVHSPLTYFGRADGTWIVNQRDPTNAIVRTFSDRASAEAATSPDNVYMKPFNGTEAERFQYLRGVFGLSSCPSAGSSERNFYPALRAAYQKAKPLATSEKQKKDLRLMQKIAAGTWLALPSDAPYEANPLAKVPDQIRRELE